MLKGKKIQLRAMEPEDVDVLYQWENDPDKWKITGTFAPVSRFALEQYVLATENDFFTHRQLRLMIVENKKHQTIGSIDLFNFKPLYLRAEVGILIIEEFQRKGMGKESLELCIEYAQKTLGLHQIYSNIQADNKASIALFKNAGFQFVGRKKDWIKENDIWKDMLMYQLLLK
jgi:diamine N-acetyltransferase